MDAVGASSSFDNWQAAITQYAFCAASILGSNDLSLAWVNYISYIREIANLHSQPWAVVVEYDAHCRMDMMRWSQSMGSQFCFDPDALAVRNMWTSWLQATQSSRSLKLVALVPKARSSTTAASPGTVSTLTYPKAVRRR